MLSTPGRLLCAHCDRLILHSGVVGPWLLRPCHDRRCREAHDGAWNLIVRIEGLTVSLALPQALGSQLARHLGSGEGRGIEGVLAAAPLPWQPPGPKSEPGP